MSIRPIALIVACAALLGAAPKAGADDVHHYPAKFVCDTFAEDDVFASLIVRPGSYRTAINVFNSMDQTAWVYRTYTRSALVGSGPQSVTDIIQLNPMTATVIDCSTIAGAIFGTPFGQLPGKGFEGFVTLTTFEDLDVAAVYTSGPEKGTVATMQVLPIARKEGAVIQLGTKKAATGR